MVLGEKPNSMILLQQDVNRFEKQGPPTERLLSLTIRPSSVKRASSSSLCGEKSPEAVQRCIVVLGERVEVFCSEPLSNSTYVKTNVVGHGR
jgi:hypothetical protein